MTRVILAAVCAVLIPGLAGAPSAGRRGDVANAGGGGCKARGRTRRPSSAPASTPGDRHSQPRNRPSWMPRPPLWQPAEAATALKSLMARIL